jgi:outer membrane protein OmpA-like peptidoglycan-associated protein
VTDRRLTLPAPFSFRIEAVARSWPRPLALALVAGVAARGVTVAEDAIPRAQPSVIVDWSAFDSLGPAPLHPGFAPVTLHPPVARAAALAPVASASAPGVVNVVDFGTGSAALLPAGRRLLDSVARTMAANPRLRVELVAHAAGDDVTARRLSLVRAVEMRSYLLDDGVEDVRMDVRALGNRNDGGRAPSDRVDVVLVEH